MKSMKKPKLIEQRVSDLEHKHGLQDIVVIEIDGDDPEKEAKIAAAEEEYSDQRLVVIIKTVV